MRLKLPEVWPSEAARQLYISIRKGGVSVYAAGKVLAEFDIIGDYGQLAGYLKGKRKPGRKTAIGIARFHPAVSPSLWDIEPSATVAETLAHFEDAA